MNIMKKSILFLSAYMMLWSCSTMNMDEAVQSDSEPVVIEASIGTETRTSMGEDGEARKVLWSEGDRIMVAYGYKSAVFRTDEGGSATASFVLESVRSNVTFESGVMAGYPSETCYISEPDPEVDVNVTLPSVQKYVPDSFDDDVMPMLSDLSYDEHLVFRNIAGVLRLMISSDCGPVQVESITLKADKPLSGSGWYMPSTDTYSYDESGFAMGKNAVRLQTETPVEVGSEAVPFNVVVPHQNYEELQVNVVLADGSEQVFTMKEGRNLNVQRSTILNIPLTIDEPAASVLPHVNLKVGDIFYDTFNVTFSFENTSQYYCGLVKARDFNKEDVLFSLDYLTPNTAAAKTQASVTRVHSDFSEFQILPGASYVFWIVPCNPDELYSESDIAYIEVTTKNYQPGGSVSVTGLSGLTVGTNSVEFDMNVVNYEKIICQLVLESELQGMDDQAKIDYLLSPDNQRRNIYVKKDNITSYSQYHISSGTDYVFIAIATDRKNLYGNLFEQKISTPELPYNDMKVVIDKDASSLPTVSWSVTGGEPAVYKYMFCATDEYKWTGVFGASIDNIQEKMFLESSLFYFNTTTSNTLTLTLEEGKEYVLVVSAFTSNADRKSSEVDYWIFRY